MARDDEFAESEGVVFASMKAFTTVIRAYAMCQQLEEAEAVFREMCESRERLPSHLQSSRRADDVMYTVLMQEWARQGDRAKAEEFYQRMLSEGWQPDEHCKRIRQKFQLF
eukprot:s6907_g1.t1